MDSVGIREGTIRVGQFLKLAGLAGSGSEAKLLLDGGGVEVNGTPESRRGRQLVPGDVVTALGRSTRVAGAPRLTDEPGPVQPGPGRPGPDGTG
jgi:ribosome-associated protein